MRRRTGLPGVEYPGKWPSGPPDVWIMTTVLIGVLVGLSGFLGMRLFAAVSENAALRANVALLKRRLAQR